MQFVMEGNDTEGLRYATIQTPEKYYLTWKEDSDIENQLDRALTELCGKERFLELIHDFILFDAGIKKLCRHNQYFAVRASQDHVRRREGGIIWNTQGSGKSLIMVWLAKWIREHVQDARVLIITDRTELDEQIEKVFFGVNEEIYRTKSGADMIAKLNATNPWLMCSLVHKFGGKEDGEEVGDIPEYIAEMKKALPPGFKAKGDLYVFVDECHRTQSGLLHDAMKAILPNAMFVGFTGTPLLKADKKRSIEVFGRYIHTYKFNEAVKDGVILDLRYEARDIDQSITSQKQIDQWFDDKTDLHGKCAIVTSYAPTTGRGKRRRGDGETTKVCHLPEDARRLVQRSAGDGGKQSREIRGRGEEKVHRRTGADEAADRGGQITNWL
jgi:type I restriction enzyme R subunit